MPAHEVIVVGGGIAGMTAGLFAARLGRDVAVLAGGEIGGHLVTINRIDDFPGFPGGVPGYDLCPMIEEQATAAGAKVLMSRIERLERADREWIVHAGDGEHRATVVIAATGSKLKALGVPGEERLEGRGVSHCGSCDGPLLRGRTVGVAGGGDSAIQEAIELAQHVGHVIVFHDQPELTAQHAYRRVASDHPAITIRARSLVEEIVGEESVEGVVVRNLETGDTELVELAAIFPFVGLQPQTAFLQDAIELDDSGHVATDASMRTVAEGLFSVGDIRRDSARQAIAAAGDGATAAVCAHRHLSGEPWPRSDETIGRTRRS